ncbi:hypothetical protein [Sphingobacterium wenxiniae]|uniref:Outer membrane protein beta-barrel domain-containing protein n=1 Tax=Sphingobacterium wenxiniae TaxID=683125 RepID=A0A1I6TJW6_9SPHI|nr:hypothetical protein [Sphingobacterium wenxiniae]SFS89552.1 hypothetical protein SAMN05660206_106196 [Sphingobacterium wenxiniae]
MKKSIFILVAIFIAVAAHAQPFQKGTTTANVGIGLGTALGGLGKARPAISASLDHGLWEVGGPGVISMGGYIGNTGYKYTDAGYTAKWNYIIAGVRGAYHYNGFTSVPNLDVYGGAMLGYNIVKYSSDGSDVNMSNTYGSGVGFSGFLGGRWFFSQNIGGYAELGYGVSVLNVGITFKF